MNKLIILILSVYTFLLVKEKEEIIPYKITKEHKQAFPDFHKLEIGFNIGYLARANVFKLPLKKIAQTKQFHYIRVYEPFGKSLYNNPNELFSRIEMITSQGFKLLISLSNYPYEDGKRPSDHTLISEFEELNDEAIDKIYSYSNRYPPTHQEQYNHYLENFLKELKKRRLLDIISFEIGNEPDSKKYFWGTPEQFEVIKTNTIKILEAYNADIICCGFTASLLTSEPDYRRQKYLAVLDNKFNPKTPFSFHIYFNSNNQNRNFDTVSLKMINGGTITEYGIYSKLTINTTAKNFIYNSPQYLYWFAKLLSFTYIHNINKVYLWKLADDPDQKGLPGYFDKNGNPKENYKYLNLVLDVIKDGYIVERDLNYIKIIGKEKTLQVSLKSSKINIEKNKTIIQSSQKDTRPAWLNEKEWIIYINRNND